MKTVAVGEEKFQQDRPAQRDGQRDESVAADAESAQVKQVADLVWQLLQLILPANTQSPKTLHILTKTSLQKDIHDHVVGEKVEERLREETNARTGSGLNVPLPGNAIAASRASFGDKSPRKRGFKLWKG